MRRILPLALAAMLLAAPANAQIAPMPSFDDPRLQTIVYEPNLPIRLVLFPDAGMTVLFHPGERIERVVVGDGAAYRAAVVGSSDSIELVPLKGDASSTMNVATNIRSYNFELETGRGLAAAFLVRFVSGAGEASEEIRTAVPDPAEVPYEYRLKGDRELRPSAIVDDGSKTYLQWGEHQSLPAVFGIGPSGGEEIVAGYMRGDFFVIDRIYSKLVFRIDKAKAEAQRREKRR